LHYLNKLNPFLLHTQQISKPMHRICLKFQKIALYVPQVKRYQY